LIFSLLAKSLESVPHNTGKARIANPRQQNKIVPCYFFVIAKAYFQFIFHY